MPTAVQAKATASVAGIGIAGAVLVTSPAIVGDGVRRFKITASFYEMESTVATDVFDLSLRDNITGTFIKTHRVIVQGSVGGWVGSDGQTLVTTHVPNVGSHTFSFIAARILGTGTGTVSASASAPIDILVEPFA